MQSSRRRCLCNSSTRRWGQEEPKRLIDSQSSQLVSSTFRTRLFQKIRWKVIEEDFWSPHAHTHTYTTTPTYIHTITPTCTPIQLHHMYTYNYTKCTQHTTITTCTHIHVTTPTCTQIYNYTHMHTYIHTTNKIS